MTYDHVTVHVAKFLLGKQGHVFSDPNQIHWFHYLKHLPYVCLDQYGQVWLQSERPFSKDGIYLADREHQYQWRT